MSPSLHSQVSSSRSPTSRSSITPQNSSPMQEDIRRFSPPMSSTNSHPPITSDQPALASTSVTASALPAGVQTLYSKGEIMAARSRAGDPATFLHTDCYCLSPLPDTNDELWISSPNMHICPEVPTLLPGQSLTYYGDGMLGPFEFMKWPQALYLPEPHAIAAPVYEGFFRYNLACNQDSIPAPSFSLQEAGAVLPKYADDGIVWEKDLQRWFTVIEQSPWELIGIATKAYIARLEAAASEARAMASEGFAERLLRASSMSLTFPGKYASLRAPIRRFCSATADRGG